MKKIMIRDRVRIPYLIFIYMACTKGNVQSSRDIIYIKDRHF